MTYLYNLLLIPLYYFVTYHFFPEKLARKCFFLIVIIHAVLFRALSNPYDYVDTLGYAEAFGIISEMSFKEAVLSVNYFTGWGQGYVTLNWLIGQWTDNPIFLFLYSQQCRLVELYFITIRPLTLPFYPYYSTFFIL